MTFLWLLIGFLVGLLVAWFYLDSRYKQQLAEREAEASRQTSGGEAAIAYNQERARVSELNEEIGQRDRKIKQLEEDLAECRAKAAAAASRPTASAPASAAPAHGTSPPASPTPAASPAAGPAPAASPPATAMPAAGTGAADSGEGDDLTRIKGIGHVLKGKLNRLGVTTFRQIAEFTEADIERINAELDFPGRIERERWIEQARKMVGYDS